MNNPTVYRIMADALLVTHFAFVAFVVLGFMLRVAGLLASWAWASNRVFRLTHLGAIGIVVAQAWLGRICPLTAWENALRMRAGEGVYTETFIQHWLHRVLFYDAEPRVFTAIYTVFGVLVLLAWAVDRSRHHSHR
ncbi:MAG: DUF2784 domain-containing protein [Gammaproteobacteria bacterium]|nr:MAG: DUF2784 domain-containing protein [Gammaproteobacteria bacterium]